MHNHVDIHRWRNGKPIESARDALAIEEPLEIRVRGRAVSVTMRTPGHDDELAAGFLLSEGVLRGRDDIARIDPCVRAAEGNVINVFLSPRVDVDMDKLTRHVFASSSCGVCGKATIDAICVAFDPVASGCVVADGLLQHLPDLMRQSQAAFDQTGGLHAAALFSADGSMLVLREDVGRHNAVDKVMGWAFMKGLVPLDRHILLVSGRASFEIMQKALAGRLPIVCAVSAPSSLAVDFALRCGQTLVGFLRHGRMNIYAGVERIAMSIHTAAADQPPASKPGYSVIPPSI